MRKKTYQQNCSLAYSTDLLGERWTLLIFRELLIQPCRFKELNEYLQGMGTNLLASRLKELESEGLIEKQSPDSKRSPYQLTAKGRKIEPITLEFIRWGYRYFAPTPGYSHWDHWDLLAMKAFFIAGRCQQSVTVQFDCPTLTAWVEVSPSGFDHGLGHHASADLLIASTIIDLQADLQAGVYDHLPRLKSFVDCFELPQ
jgi:DNA-binding HxlR family transcriptional regulator